MPHRRTSCLTHQNSAELSTRTRRSVSPSSAQSRRSPRAADRVHRRQGTWTRLPSPGGAMRAARVWRPPRRASPPREDALSAAARGGKRSQKLQLACGARMRVHSHPRTGVTRTDDDAPSVVCKGFTIFWVSS